VVNEPTACGSWSPSLGVEVPIADIDGVAVRIGEADVVAFLRLAVGEPEAFPSRRIMVRDVDGNTLYLAQ
jgi:hypothetical protein